MNTAAIIDAILLAEGSTYTDRPDDRGGPTKFGIDLQTLTAYRSPAQTQISDVANITADDARAIYQRAFINTPGFNNIIDSALQALIVDAGVQHGVVEAAKMLQRAAGVTPVDGKIGPASLNQINAAPATRLRALVCSARLQLYGSIIADDPALQKARTAGFHLQADNALGWAHRIAPFVESLG